MSQINLNCTNRNCNAELSFSTGQVGSMQSCPNCGQKLYVPDYNSQEKIGYDMVEDIAKTDYKVAAIITVVYVLSNVFLSEFMLTSKIGLCLNAITPFVIWRYFKFFFIELKDYSTAKFINWIYVGYAIFIPLLMLTLFGGWDEKLGRTIGEFIWNIIMALTSDNHSANTEEAENLVWAAKMVAYSFLIVVILLWVTGIKILTVNKKYNFPLKRIALSTMLFIPVHMFYLLAYAVANKIPDSFFMHIIAMIPYILLSIHFYRADMEDATRG